MVTAEEWGRELSERRRKVWDVAASAGCDVHLVYGSPQHTESFRYLTNFVPVLGDTWALMTGPEDATCVLNFHWELDEARRVSGIADWYGHFDPVPFLVDWMNDVSPQRVAVVGMERIPWTIFDALKDAVPDAEMVDVGGSLDQMRRIKSPLEIALLRESARITDEAISAARGMIAPGVSEFEISATVLDAFNRRGAGFAFRPMIIAGVDEESAVIGRSTRPRPLEPGDTVMIDIGAEVQGYQSDMARTFVLGELSPMQQKVWDVVRRAYDAAIGLARPGVACNELHRAAEEIINRAGFELIHRIGHGFGLGTSFEWPSLDTETTPLSPGMTFALEPAIYEPGAGAMKIEDMVVITEDGCELLTRSPYDLEI